MVTSSGRVVVAVVVVRGAVVMRCSEGDEASLLRRGSGEFWGGVEG